MKYIPIMLLVFILILPALTLLTLRKEIGLKQTNEGKVLFFYGNHNYLFSITSPKENLNSIVIKLKNISIRNTKPVYFNLLSNRETTRQIKINGSNIGDGEMVRFAFEEIKDSKNKIYTVVLNSPESEEKEALGIHTDTLDNPVIITYHIPTSRLHLILDIYKNIAERILEDKLFTVTWLILLGSIIFAINSLNI